MILSTFDVDLNIDIFRTNTWNNDTCEDTIITKEHNYFAKMYGQKIHLGDVHTNDKLLIILHLAATIT